MPKPKGGKKNTLRLWSHRPLVTVSSMSALLLVWLKVEAVPLFYRPVARREDVALSVAQSWHCRCSVKASRINNLKSMYVGNVKYFGFTWHAWTTALSVTLQCPKSPVGVGT